MTEEQKEKVNIILAEIVDAIQEAIDASPRGIPNGHLYARLMGCMSLDTYTQIIGAMKKAGRIKEEYNLLTSTKTK